MYFFKYKQPYFTGTEIDSKRKINHATYNRLILGSVSFGINFASYNLLSYYRKIYYSSANTI